mmetsp:Transcript_13041/g.26632  ORF Transcript_13041/g.26632 Transcript_13041/m.26632 type:complete len:207 (+) Transcript_13041:48-668(+)
MIVSCSSYCYILLIFLFIQPYESFSPSLSLSNNPPPKPSFADRRGFLSTISTTFVSVAIPSSSNAVVIETSDKAGGMKPKDEKEARERLKEASKTISTLLSTYDTITQGSGDNIRRYLGTVGTSSPLYGLKPSLKYLQEYANDVVEYTEAMEEYDRCLNGADGQAYSSMFVEFSAAKGKQEDYYREAKREIQGMQTAMDNMEKELQ